MGDFMSKTFTTKKILSLILLIFILAKPITSFAYMGSMGYEGGISAADPFEKNTYVYREVCFLSGTPIVLEGEMTVKKSVKNELISTTYTYNLSNVEHDATITRVIVINTYTETSENGQTREKSEVVGRPTEIVRIGSTTYVLNNYEFTRSGITDKQPAVYYNVGEYMLKKIYSINNNGGNVTVEMTGTQYGYDQYWSSAKSGMVDVYIYSKSDPASSTNEWGGFAEVFVSNVSKKGFQYIENQPFQISFEGGYVEKDWEEGVLEYNAQLPEFDMNKNPTGVLKNYYEKMGIEPKPTMTRLMVPDLKHLEGHWAEESAKILYSLGVIPGTGEDFNPEQYITRSEFTVMLVRALKDIPEDPDLITRQRTTTTNRSRSKEPEISPFLDIKIGDTFYADIKTANDRGIITGTGNSYFSPERHITSSEVVTMIIRALGLEGLSSYPNAITPFVDNDDIPAYARNSVDVAYRIGLVSGDSRGYFRPNEKLTYQKAAVLLCDLIEYMGEDLVKDYRERFLSY